MSRLGRARQVALGLTAALFAPVLVWSVWQFFNPDAGPWGEHSRLQVDLVGTLVTDVRPPDPYLDAVDVTAELCGPVTDCVQAVRSDYATFMKFPSSLRAEAYTANLADGVQVQPLVISFDGRRPNAEERHYIVRSVQDLHMSRESYVPIPTGGSGSAAARTGLFGGGILTP